MLLDGATYRRTAEKFNVGLATLNRIVKDARKKAPDFDDLRQLNSTLKKLDLTPFDVMSVLPLFAQFKELNVGVEELPSFVEVTTQLAKRKGIQAAQLVNAMQELVKLEDQTGKSHGELVKDLKSLQVKINDMNRKMKNLQNDKQRLDSELEQERRKLHQIISIKKSLKKLDLDKLASLVEFADKKERLEKKFQQEKMQLDGKIERLNTELKGKEKKHRWLKGEIEGLWNETSNLQRRVSKLGKLSTIVEKGMAIIPCKNCGLEGVFLRFPNRPELLLSQMTGVVWSSRCACCGQQVQYTAIGIFSPMSVG